MDAGPHARPIPFLHRYEPFGGPTVESYQFVAIGEILVVALVKRDGPSKRLRLTDLISERASAQEVLSEPREGYAGLLVALIVPYYNAVLGQLKHRDECPIEKCPVRFRGEQLVTVRDLVTFHTFTIWMLTGRHLKNKL